MDVLRQIFGQHVISKNGELQWPPRSPDLTAPDFFLWGYLKEKVFASNPKKLAELKDKITEEIRRIDATTLERVMESVLSRARSCVAHKGDHLTDVVFHA